MGCSSKVPTTSIVLARGYAPERCREGNDAEHVQRLYKTSLGSLSLAENDRHECWVRIREPRFRCLFHRPFVKYCSSSSRFWKRHADKPPIDPPDVKHFALVPLRRTLLVVNVLQVRISLKSCCVLQSRVNWANSSSSASQVSLERLELAITSARTLRSRNQDKDLEKRNFPLPI